MEAFKKVRGRRSFGLREKFLEKGIIHHILWAACRSDQTSADAHIAGGWHGAFTYYFCQVMNATQNKLARNDVLTKVSAKLSAGEYDQVPQLECEATIRNSPVT
jgi:hypothetical protein